MCVLERLCWYRVDQMAPTTTMTVGRAAWSLVCWNLSETGGGGGARSAAMVWPVNATGGEVADDSRDRLDDRDRHALLYIVVVLLFYSTGIVVAIVMYLKREKAEIEEEKAYDDYARYAYTPTTNQPMA